MRFQNLLLKEDGEKREHEENRVEKDTKEKQEEKNNFLSIIVNEILYSGKYIIYSS